MKNDKKVKEELWCEGLKDGNTLRSRSRGDSMAPFIRDGNVLLIKPADEIYLGDVIAFRNNQGIIAHRVIEKNKIGSEFYYTTKGDNLPYKDDPMRKSKVLGKVIEVEAKRKKIDMQALPRRLQNYAVALVSHFLPRALPFLQKIKNTACRNSL